MTGNLKYYIFDPTGNITALVETAVDVADQPEVASGIMELEPDVEQVGFVTFDEDAERMEGGVPVSLRMAGGEFCGNATMCAAALFALKSGLQSGAVAVKVSGASAPLTVSLERHAESEFGAAVTMPPALSIKEIKLTAGSLTSTETVDTETGSAALTLPVVEMEGISHIIIEPDSGFFGLKDDAALAESLLRQWCSALGADCLGMMFLGEEAVGSPAAMAAGRAEPADRAGSSGSSDRAVHVRRPLTPLVYVPGANTMFWENSCASGSAATGMYLAAKAGSPVDVTLEEPAGSLRVESDPSTGITVLHGSARLQRSVIPRGARPTA